MRGIFGTALSAAALFAGQSLANDLVEIRTLDDTLVIKGELLSFTDEIYEVKAAVGIIRIPINMATCVGEACPAPDSFSSKFNIAAATSSGGDLMVRLIGGFAGSLDAEVYIDFDPAARVMQVGLKDASDEELASIALERADSSLGYRNLLEGKSDIILASRRVTAAEQDAFDAAGLGSVVDVENEVVLALDGIATVVSDDNFMRSISLEEIAAIFSGAVQSWAEFGGPDRPIRLIVSDEDEEAVNYFSDAVLSPRNASLAASVETAANNAAVAAAVLEDPLAIGITTLGNIGDSKALPIRLSCGLTAAPTTFSVKSEEYPLARRLFMYSRNPQGLPSRALGLLEYARSLSGQVNVAEAGFVDQGVSTRGLGDVGLRLVTALATTPDAAGAVQLRDLAAELIDADQLSTTLRFRTASAQLDSKAEADVERLAALFSSPEYANKEILLAGFTDSIGRLDLNITLATRRADQVKNSIIAASNGVLGPQSITTLGYGPTAPVGCNDNVVGRQVNRRVEVWVRDRR